MNIEKEENIKFDRIRYQYDQDSRKWYFSIVDVIAIISKSTDPRNYWKVLKNRLKKSQNQLVTQCNQLKMLASDGKFYLTDVANEQTLLYIIQTVSPDSLPDFEDWINKLEHKKKTPVKNEDSVRLTSYNDEESYPQNESTELVESEDMMLMVDGYKKDNFIFIHAFVAGSNIENIFISITCNSVTIKGERKINKGIVEENYVEQELAWGNFTRTIPLQEEIEINQTEVVEQHGEIKIKLSLINKNRSRILKIKSIV